MNKNMTSGNISQALTMFVIPLALGNIFQQLYNITDTYIIGKCVDSHALAAVGSVSSIIFLFNAILFGLRSGVSIVSSTHFGEQRPDRVKSVIHTGLCLLLLIGIFCTLIGLLGADSILRIMQTPDRILADATLYFHIYSAGFIPLFLFNFCNAVFQSLGESVIPFTILVISTILNVVLDIAFVYSFHMGVAGAGYATVLAETLSALIACIILSRRLRYLEGTAPLFDRTEFIAICRIGIPSVLQQSIVSIGFLTVQSLINRCGADTVAGYTIASKIDGIASIPVVTIGEAVSVFTAQNIGAGKPERILKGIFSAIRIDMVFVTLLALISCTMGKQIICLFLSSDYNPAIIEAGMGYLTAMIVGLFAMSILRTFNGALCGMQKMKGFLASYLSNIISRIVVAYCLFLPFGRTGIWISLPVSMILGAVISVVCFYLVEEDSHFYKW